MINKSIFINIILILILNNIAAAVVYDYDSVREEIEDKGDANVIVRIIDEPPLIEKGKITLKASAKVNREKILDKLKNKLSNTKKHNIINGFSGKLTKSGLKELDDSDINFILEADKILPFPPFTQTNPHTLLDVSTSTIGANYSWNKLNITGRNVTVAVIDSGIYYNHTDLGSCFGAGCRVKGGYDFFYGDADPMDSQGHGTHVAGIIGANGTVKGVAPEVEFFALQACGDTEGEGCGTVAIIQSLEWAVNNSADIASISIGGGIISTTTGNTGKDSISAAVDNTVNSGIVVVIAAGNDGPGTSTINNPGASVLAITVGSVDDQGTVVYSDDSIAGSSSRGPGGMGRLDPDISAPGEAIYSTWNDGGYQTNSGTSMAAPHVSGAAALLLEQNRNLTPQEIRKILIGSVSNISGNVFAKGAGELNVRAALVNNVRATVQAINMYSSSSNNDRWEFVADIWGKRTANVTITNDNAYDVNFSSISLSSFENMENSDTLNLSMFEIPSEIIISSSSNQTITFNFTVINFADVYKTTYGGNALLSGSYNNGTSNVSLNLTIPIVATIPILNYIFDTKTLDNTGTTSGSYLARGDNFGYAYYNNKSGNDTFEILWNSSSDDLDLFIYNTTGDLDVYSAQGGTNQESTTSLDTSTLKWFRIYGYEFSGGTINVSLNITDTDNNAPTVNNVTNSSGQDSFTVNFGTNSTIKVNYSDPENDSVTITINDSNYQIENSSPNEFITYYWETNASDIGSYSIKITLTDVYNETSTTTANVTVQNASQLPPNIISYYPSDLTPSLEKNNPQIFNVTADDPNNLSLDYTWYVNEAQNSTGENYTFISSKYSAGTYNITVVVNNTYFNVSVEWIMVLSDVTQPDDPPSSSGGGGGGSIRITDTGTYSKRIREAEDKFTIKQPFSSIAVKRLNININKKLQDVRINLTALDKEPDEVKALKDIYKIIEITHENIEDADIELVTINFSVNKTWLKNSDLDNVVLQRYNKVWVELETEYKESDENFHFYESESPGLSLFVISLKQPIPKKEPVQKDLPEPELILLEEDSPNLEETKEVIQQLISTSVNEQRDDNSSGYIIGMIILVFITLAIILVKHLTPTKKKKK